MKLTLLVLLVSLVLLTLLVCVQGWTAGRDCYWGSIPFKHLSLYNGIQYTYICVDGYWKTCSGGIDCWGSELGIWFLFWLRNSQKEERKEKKSTITSIQSRPKVCKGCKISVQFVIHPGSCQPPTGRHVPAADITYRDRDMSFLRLRSAIWQVQKSKIVINQAILVWTASGAPILKATDVLSSRRLLWWCWPIVIVTKPRFGCCDALANILRVAILKRKRFVDKLEPVRTWSSWFLASNQIELIQSQANVAGTRVHSLFFCWKYCVRYNQFVSLVSWRKKEK